MTDIIKLGDYIVIKKHNYKRLHKFNKSDSCVNLGRDNINLSGIEGCSYYSIFKMISSTSKRNRDYYLELTEDPSDLKDEIDVKTSGVDNRKIFDDGFSQKLSSGEIEALRNECEKASDIVETLISNSNTFHNKTEFSQEKYLRKKERKYFEYLQILQPNLRIISEIMFQLDSNKIQGIRIDTLSQIITMSNIHCEGSHLLYDSGSNGLLAAALLSAMGPKSTGKLIHMHPGNMSQKQALLAMNFNIEQLNQCISVNIYSVLREYYQGQTTNEDIKIPIVNQKFLKRKASDDLEVKTKIQKTNEMEKDISEGISVNIEDPKKPKWHYDNIAASKVLHSKVDSLVIACKEDSLNLFNELVNFVKPGRPFVIYTNFIEPLQHLYLELKQQSNISALKLTNNWMRKYQILPDRTHPEVMMNASSGFLLSGYVLQ